jgi:hypothetical protein
MADTKITALAAITTVDPAADVLPIVDVSDTSMAASGTTKKITSNQILGAGGTATLASATITGDLTVDTSTLKVDSANNRVGIGTATPNDVLEVVGNGATGVRVSRAGLSTQYATLSAGATGPTLDASSALSELTFGIAGSNKMTLNSTGLGVGASPSHRLTVSGTAATNTTGLGLIGTTTGYNRVLINNTSGGGQFGVEGSTGGSICNSSTAYSTIVGSYQNYPLHFITNNNVQATIDSSGNVGVGVTPSAWAAYKAVQIGRGSFSSDTSSGTTISTLFGTNFVYDGNWKYIVSAAATFFQQANGAYYWFNEAGTKTAGATFTPVQAMTLDASGNLLVGKAALSDTTVGWYVRPNGITTATMSSSVNTDTSYQLYSTGASAYRFYVGMGGTVYATNTTISAISDARLKENVQDIDVGLDAILALKPRKFDWKTGKGKNIKGDRGFIAQEFETVFPNLIDEWKDPAPEGEAPYKSVRQDLIPVLVKAIQELTARVEALEA